MGEKSNRLQRLINIYRVVQISLLGLFLYMAYHFQQLSRAKGTPQVFLNSIITALVIQLLLFYPLRKLALLEAKREAASQAPDVSPEAKKSHRRQRIFSDMIKACVFIFFTTFIVLAPPATFILSTTFFTFILTVLTYAQCFNFSLSRLIRQKP